MHVLFFLGIFFLRTLDCLVPNCSWRNSWFIGIKFTVLPLPPSCWNIRKTYAYMYGSQYLYKGQLNYRIYLYFDGAIIGKQLLANLLQFHIQVIF